MSKYAFLVAKNLTSSNDATAIMDPGQLVYDPNAMKTYQYVKFVAGTTAVATANGAVAYWYGPAGGTGLQGTGQAGAVVTSTLSYSLATTAANNQNFVAGVFLNVVTTAQYCFIQIGGEHTAVVDTTAADVPGSAIIASATTNGEAVGVVAGTAPGFRILGYGLKAQAAGVIDTMLVLDRTQ